MIARQDFNRATDYKLTLMYITSCNLLTDVFCQDYSNTAICVVVVLTTA